MSKLEELVPPLELCKLIPKGEFADSVFVWFQMYQGEKHRVRRRDLLVNDTNAIPAPTLREIMKNTRSNEQFFCSFYDGRGDEDEQSWSIGDGELDFFVPNGFEGKNPEELALKWWLQQKGIEYE